jgi:hypothetical protein
MQELPKLFSVLGRSLRASTDGIAHAFSVSRHGLAGAASLVVFAGERGTAQVGLFAAGKELFEGHLASVQQLTWSGDDVLSGDVGIEKSTSAVVDEFRVYAKHVVDGAQYFAAAVIGGLKDRTGYLVGDPVNALTSGFDVKDPVTVYATSLTAGTFRSLKAGLSYQYVAEHDYADICLDGVYSAIGQGDVVVIEDGTALMATTVDAVLVTELTTQDDINIPATKITISPASKIAQPTFSESIRIWFNAKKAGTLERIPTRTVTKDHFLNIACPVTLPPDTLLPKEDTFIVIQDAEGTTLRAKGGGQGDSDNPQIMITELLEEFGDDEELVKPITFLWGLTKVTRGETVHREAIGSGDATQRWQSFRLAKSPLTYVADPSAPGGRRAELEVFVNGIKWRRAQSFYKAGPTDEIYIIRHDADHNTFVQFGDGELGKRLPTGKNNVVATYRHGVGGNVEANTITELVRPIKGVTSVNNPLPATGGEDPPTEAEAREKAIQSTRVLGRLVSVVDFEVEAARYGGVIRAKALWGWDKAADDAVVKVWIICADEGDPSPDLRTYLIGMAEPEVRVGVYKAKTYSGELTIKLELDPNYLPEEIYAAVHERLFDEFDGLLAPRNVPIGGVFHRSELYAAIHEINGVLSVQSVFIDNIQMPKRITLQEGQYLALTPKAG